MYPFHLCGRLPLRSDVNRNKDELPVLEEVADTFYHHTRLQLEALTTAHKYFIDLDGLHSALKIEKESKSTQLDQLQTVDFYAQVRTKLAQWDVGVPKWQLSLELHPAAEHASVILGERGYTQSLEIVSDVEMAIPRKAPAQTGLWDHLV